MSGEVNPALVITHELKAPLALVRQLALNIDESNTDDVIDTKKQIVKVSERAMRQVNDLAKIFRLDDSLFEMEPLSVNQICEEVIEELGALFLFNKRELEVFYLKSSALTVSNKELLKSIVYNFCLNAMQYSGETTKSELKVLNRQGKIRVEVRDFGPALPIKIWRELRDGGVRKPTNISMRPGSSGLGLYIASKFSEYLGLNIGAIRHSDGTSFFVDLEPSRQRVLPI